METNGKLQVYELRLTTSGPLFIGDGRTLPKKSYLYNQRRGTVSIFDETKLFTLLLERNLVDKYEQFMMGRESNLYAFLKYTCGLEPRDWEPAVRYQVEAMDSLDPDHSLKDIHAFIRNACGQAYVPGSSVKGALRTVLLHQMIRQEAPHQKLNESRDWKSMGEIPEGKYLNTLSLNKKRPTDMVNSIMRGVQISDSLPIPDDAMMLAMKQDVYLDGSVWNVPVCRECIRPDWEIRLKLTLDQSILQGKITKEILVKAIEEFDVYYWDMYFRKFNPPEGEADFPFQRSLILGGGSGFFAKSLVYPYLGEDRALNQTTAYMKEHFPRHKHKNDCHDGISPHMMKYTEFDWKRYPMGLCEVEIQ